MPDTRQLLEDAVAELPRGLSDHVLRVVTEARRLAGRYDVDEERAVLAALGHDLARALAPDDLLRQAQEAGLDVTDIGRSQPILLHGRLGAHIMADRFGIEDREALDAARYHTTARAGMSALERLIFVADKTEPGKADRDPVLAGARRLADEGLEQAMLAILDRQVSKALSRGWPLHPDTVAARNELVLLA